MKKNTTIHKEETFPKIYVLAYPHWINGYQLSMHMYGYCDNNVYKVISKHKNEFFHNNKNEILSKPRYLMKKIREYLDLSPTEIKTLNKFIDSEEFRYTLYPLQFYSIKEILSFIKSLSCVQYETTINLHDNKRIETNDIEKVKKYVKMIERTIDKEFIQRDIIIKKPNDFSSDIIYSIFLLQTAFKKNFSLRLIKKIAKLPVPIFDDRLLSITTASLLKSKEILNPTD